MLHFLEGVGARLSVSGEPSTRLVRLHGGVRGEPELAVHFHARVVEGVQVGLEATDVRQVQEEQGVLPVGAVHVNDVTGAVGAAVPPHAAPDRRVATGTGLWGVAADVGQV